MNQIMSVIQEANTIAISGHVRPDGDCVGSCMGLYGYIKGIWPEKKVVVSLEEIPPSLQYLSVPEAFVDQEEKYDLFIALDCGDESRLGDAASLFRHAEKTVNIDHHASNIEFAKINHVIPHASSTCEVLFSLFEEEKVDYAIACALFTGLIHDTGVFKHSNTSGNTMRVAGKLIDKGLPFTKIIEESFYLKSYRQLQILGRCLLASIRILDEKCIFAVVTKRMLEFYEATPADLDGVIDQLRSTEGIEVAILLDERAPGEYKVSMRSNHEVNVSQICSYFGGGGHIKAAGCSISGSAHDVINNLTKEIEKQL